MTDNRICAIALAAALATICFIPPSIAAPFDGNWSVVAQTTWAGSGPSGVCSGVWNAAPLRQTF